MISYYFGANLGASIAAGSDGRIELLRAIITKVVKPPVTGDKVRPRLVKGEKHSLLVIFNDTPKDQAPASTFRHATRGPRTFTAESTGRLSATPYSSLCRTRMRQPCGSNKEAGGAPPAVDGGQSRLRLVKLTAMRLKNRR